VEFCEPSCDPPPRGRVGRPSKRIAGEARLKERGYSGTLDVEGNEQEISESLDSRVSQRRQALALVVAAAIG
jgi:hypothetical protein